MLFLTSRFVNNNFYIIKFDSFLQKSFWLACFVFFVGNSQCVYIYNCVKGIS